MRTLTIKPDFMTTEEHRRAEREGWSIFYVSTRQFGRTRSWRPQVQRLDEKGILDSDEQAYVLARAMGVNIDENGYVLSPEMIRDGRFTG